MLPLHTQPVPVMETGVSPAGSVFARGEVLAARVAAKAADYVSARVSDEKLVELP
jgi:hypothetical protein